MVIILDNFPKITIVIIDAAVFDEHPAIKSLPRGAPTSLWKGLDASRRFWEPLEASGMGLLIASNIASRTASRVRASSVHNGVEDERAVASRILASLASLLLSS